MNCPELHEPRADDYVCHICYSLILCDSYDQQFNDAWEEITGITGLSNALNKEEK